jgi:hypothetical protein
MDNVATYGFRPYRSRGAKLDPIKCLVATGYQAAPGAVNCDLNIGDPVALVSTGTVALMGAGSAAKGYGVIVGVAPYWDGSAMQPTNKLPGGTAWGTIQERASYVYVLPFWGITYEVDVDDAVTATTLAGYQAFVQENVDLVYSAVSASKKAFPRIDISGHATTNTLQFRIVGISDNQANQDFSGANVKLLVECNLPEALSPLGV